jgi:hypothetical protein
LRESIVDKLNSGAESYASPARNYLDEIEKVQTFLFYLLFICVPNIFD